MVSFVRQATCTYALILHLKKASAPITDILGPQVPLRKLRLDGAACHDGGLVVISALPHLTSLHIGARHTHQVLPASPQSVHGGFLSEGTACTPSCYLCLVYHPMIRFSDLHCLQYQSTASLDSGIHCIIAVN